jgi:hypothetical protein
MEKINKIVFMKTRKNSLENQMKMSSFRNLILNLKDI